MTLEFLVTASSFLLAMIFMAMAMRDKSTNERIANLALFFMFLSIVDRNLAKQQFDELSSKIEQCLPPEKG